jgi:hypothetical protein
MDFLPTNMVFYSGKDAWCDSYPSLISRIKIRIRFLIREPVLRVRIQQKYADPSGSRSMSKFY